MLFAALDTETTGPDFHHGCRPFFVSTCTEEGAIRCWEWPVHRTKRKPIIPLDELEQVQDFVDSHKLVFHNTKFDVRALESIGINFTDEHWSLMEDTLVASHLLRSNEGHGLKFLADLHLDVDDSDQKDLRDAVVAARRIGKQQGWNICTEGHPHMPGLKFGQKAKTWAMDMWLPKAVATHLGYPEDDSWHTVLYKYGSTDAERTIALWDIFHREMEKRGHIDMYTVRKEMLHPLYDMESTGITFSESQRLKVHDQYVEEVKEETAICQGLARVAGGEIDNLGSFKQLQPLLFETLKVPLTTATKTGYTTQKDELRISQLEMSPRSPGYHFIDHLCEVNQRKTAVNYLKSYERFCMPYTDHEWDIVPEWMVLHTNFNMTGTRTTRQSSQWPNAQNISKKEGFNLRAVFGPATGRVWYAMDYANIELRILAWESEEQALIEAFERNESIHMRFAHIVCPEKIRAAGGDEAFKKTDHYRWVKNGDFSLTYGASRATADATYKIPGAYDKVRGHFTKLDKYMDLMIRIAKTKGYVTTRMISGPGYPLWVEPRKAYTQAVDYVCQGTAGWCMNLAVVDIHNYLKHYPDHHMIITIHDELVFDFPADHPDNHMIISNCAHLMAGAGHTVGLPTPVETEIITTTWDKGVPYETAI